MPKESMAEQLLAWYDRHRRVLPWRAKAGETADPYRVWLSEIMLQQTTVAAVGPYFASFLARWPSVEALAAAPLDDVLTAWAGLGYYARARNLHKCAQAVAARGGDFPSDEAGLLELPGIGAYTAAAIAAIAFDQRAAVMDGNVERVVARLYRVQSALPAAKPELRALADSLTPDQRPGDYAQAVMDLGATICTPRKPRCALCPWREACAAFKAGDAEDYPRKTPKPERPILHATAYWMTMPDGSVVLRRRKEEGLLGGMMEIPTNTWRATPWTLDEARGVAPVAAAWRDLPGNIRHVFTHIDLRLTLLSGSLRKVPDGMLAASLDKLGDYALPSVMRKIVSAAVKGG
ncbi:A/G-specific adenine glycosylase [Dongia sedimenti]|uniref:Adenine DNA glycosylase n=1 Tax=Dongia sedimenti TaxID=3064282 RepID=A0ABU0YGW9_9PROT|nr:A/G-specific adenine glycosylase [Rhodospirillaceae bacterium R-7]